MDGLTLQFVPYHEIDELPSAKRIQKIIKIVKMNKIIFLEGKLKSQEEAELIRKTMEEIDERFKGIELLVVNQEGKEEAFFRKIKNAFVSMLLGNRNGFTIIGPATIIKEIKKDPDKIQLLTQDYSKKTK